MGCLFRKHRGFVCSFFSEINERKLNFEVKYQGKVKMTSRASWKRWIRGHSIITPSLVVKRPFQPLQLNNWFYSARFNRSFNFFINRICSTLEDCYTELSFSGPRSHLIRDLQRILHQEVHKLDIHPFTHPIHPSNQKSQRIIFNTELV